MHIVLKKRLLNYVYLESVNALSKIKASNLLEPIQLKITQQLWRIYQQNKLNLPHNELVLKVI